MSCHCIVIAAYGEAEGHKRSRNLLVLDQCKDQIRQVRFDSNKTLLLRESKSSGQNTVSCTILFALIKQKRVIGFSTIDILISKIGLYCLERV